MDNKNIVSDLDLANVMLEVAQRSVDTSKNKASISLSKRGSLQYASPSESISAVGLDGFSAKEIDLAAQMRVVNKSLKNLQDLESVF